MDQPLKVSIIINNYNYGRFIAGAIDSALAQTYSHVEVIAVDDGSTDDSMRVIESYGDKIQPIFKQNGGQASAFNAGFAASSGDLVLFLDSDDVLLPTAAETVVQEWRDGLVLTYFPLETIDAYGRATGTLAGGAPMVRPSKVPFRPGSPTSGNVFSRKLLERVMPIPEQQWKICADSPLAYASRLLGPVKSLPMPLGKYRIHGQNNCATTYPDISEVRRSIRSAFVFHEWMRGITRGQLDPLEDWLAADSGHWLARMRSLRESRADHPWPDTVPGLVLRAARAIWRKPGWSITRKLAFTALDLCYAFLPSRAADRLRRLEARASKSRVMYLFGWKGKNAEPRQHLDSLDPPGRQRNLQRPREPLASDWQDSK